jgi:predicted CXXCH cytochrome family protein
MPLFRRFMAGSIVVIGFGIVGALLAVTRVAAQDGPTSTPLPRGDCGDCHLDILEAWQTSRHAQAFSDVNFQSAWHEQNQKVECLACHTTRFSRRTATYKHEGVTCEACHGVTPVDHPPQAIQTFPGVQVCEDCHTTTYSEWERSGHGDAGVACTTCHAPHPQALRAESASALCLQCHEQDQNNFAHSQHPEQQCVDCHGHRADVDVDAIHIASGNLLPTGHDSLAEPPACITCHAQNTKVEVQSVEGPTHPLIEARVHSQELKAQIDTLQTQRENTAALRLLQGLVAGAAVGGVGVLLLARRRSRRANMVVKETDNDE